MRNMITLRNLNLKYLTVDVLCAICPKISSTEDFGIPEDFHEDFESEEIGVSVKT